MNTHAQAAPEITILKWTGW